MMGKTRREDDQLTARQVAIRLSEALGRPTTRGEVMRLIETRELKAEEMRRGETVHYYVRKSEMHTYLARRLGPEPPEEVKRRTQRGSKKREVGRDLEFHLPDSPAVKVLMEDGDPTHQQLVDLKNRVNDLADKYRKEGKTEEGHELAEINKYIRKLERKARPKEGPSSASS